MIIGCMLEPSWPIGSFHESLLQRHRHEPHLVQPIPIIGAIHSACIAVSIDILNWWTAGLVLSATHKRPKGAFRASCIRQRQVMIFQILLNNGLGTRSKSFIFSAWSLVLWRISPMDGALGWMGKVRDPASSTSQVVSCMFPTEAPVTSLMRIRARLIELLVGQDLGADASFSDVG